MRIERDQIRTLALMAALLGGFLGALWLPHRLKENRLQARIEAAKTQIAADGVYAAALSGLSRDTARLREAARGSDKYISPAGEQASLLRQFSGELQNRQAVDQEIQTQPIIEGSDYNVMPVTLNFRGTCPAVFELVKTIETGRRLVRVSSLRLHNTPGKAADLLQAQVELSTFFTTSEGTTR